MIGLSMQLKTAACQLLLHLLLIVIVSIKRLSAVAGITSRLFLTCSLLYIFPLHTRAIVSSGCL